AAAKLHWAYTCGRPEQTPDPDRLDLEEWNLFKEARPIPRQVNKLARHANTDQQLQTLRIMREMSTDRMAKENQVVHIKELANCSKKEARNRAAQFAAKQAIAHGATKGKSAPSANGKGASAPAGPGGARPSGPAAAATVNNGAVTRGKEAAPAASKSAENGAVDASLAGPGRARQAGGVLRGGRTAKKHPPAARGAAGAVP